MAKVIVFQAKGDISASHRVTARLHLRSNGIIRWLVRTSKSESNPSVFRQVYPGIYSRLVYSRYAPADIDSIHPRRIHLLLGKVCGVNLCQFYPSGDHRPRCSGSCFSRKARHSGMLYVEQQPLAGEVLFSLDMHMEAGAGRPVAGTTLPLWNLTSMVSSYGAGR